MQWIWLDKEEENSFAEFQTEFAYQSGKAVLKISSDYRFAAYVNGKFASNGQYADYPEHKVYNEVDVTRLLRKGENTLFIVAWHTGQDFSVVRTMPASVAFEVICNDKPIAQSDETTLCRPSALYRGGGRIGTQQGYCYDLDFTAPEQAWQRCVVKDTRFTEVHRPIPTTDVSPLQNAIYCAKGVFRHHERANELTSAGKMQKAWLTNKLFDEFCGRGHVQKALQPPKTLVKDEGDGIYVVLDMQKEVCGHIAFTVTVDKPCTMYLGWGEHLNDLRVRTQVGDLNFGIEVRLKAGENVFDDYLMRFGCRYICLFVEGEKFTLSRLGIKEVHYPFRYPEKDFGDLLLNKLYETGRRTLDLSAHEHYEDCPWREQALYAMDSRNQMLYGYGAFEEYALPRAALRTFAYGLREDGLVALTPPAQKPLVIPSFTAYWIMALGENAERDYDGQFIAEMLPYAERAVSALLAKEGKNGIVRFGEGQKFDWNGFWNFHEWRPYMDGLDEPLLGKADDCSLTALTVCAARHLKTLYERQNNFAKAAEYGDAISRLSAKLEAYYDKEQGVYASFLKDGERVGYHVYTQSVVLYSGAVDGDRAKAICQKMKAPKENGLTEATFAALQTVYGAVMQYDGDLKFCIDDMVKRFGDMLFTGATSFWETDELWSCDDSMSLCHGWSAVCCWLFDTYAERIKNKDY